ncbi:hypothetical protein BC939DRAFT_458051 [Gamsiella multidivaricata]|uniref:uncharacterized protein n=1 Tax=Gamsiella multidivaricata TaxID=101098 RepID=UPI00221E77CF|nr:uncharacterized protein BC939DRAFT_458051 [Gamsiella multidivaricata]KAI7820467.1 hypothetical protein BC939DRAFT_458051 [Gamsiella multidivaricata]
MIPQWRCQHFIASRLGTVVAAAAVDSKVVVSQALDRTTAVGTATRNPAAVGSLPKDRATALGDMNPGAVAEEEVMAQTATLAEDARAAPPADLAADLLDPCAEAPVAVAGHRPQEVTDEAVAHIIPTSAEREQLSDRHALRGMMHH